MVRGFADAMAKSGGTRAAPIASLPERVPAAELPAEVNGLPVIAMNSDDLVPVAIDPKGGFVVTGPPGSGRTTTLVTLARAVKRWRPQAQLSLVTLRRNSELLAMPEFSATATREDEIKELCATLKERALDESSPLQVLVVEKLDDLNTAPFQSPLQEAIKPLVDNDHFVVGEADPSSLNTNMGLPGLVKSARSGIALAPDGGESSMVFKTNFPPLARVFMPEGRGVLVRRGKAEIVQMALPEKVLQG